MMRLKRSLALGAVAMSIAALAGVLTASSASAVGPGVFVIPAGATAAFTGATFGACNSLTWGFQLDPPVGAQQDQFTKPAGCFSTTAPDVTIGASAAPRTLRVYLTDNTCSITYYSDGTSNPPPPTDHVIVTPTGANAWELRFADAGGFCERKFVPLTTFTGFNFKVDLTITFPVVFPSGGAFAVGDQSATGVGANVYFWGAQWSKNNSLSAGAAPPSFKGFEDGNAAPKCGDTWTTDPGDSSNPPAAVPDFMAVIVSSNVTKSGRQISGDVKHIVIVKTNPGYAPDPGHPGTGTEVFQVC